jgi:hypothetical protein
MKLINDKDNPALVGIIENSNDIELVERMVNNLNHDLVDSGYDKYKYKFIKRGQKAYIERI